MRRHLIPSACLAFLTVAAPNWAQRPTGLIVEPDASTPTAYVFDARNDVILGSVALPTPFDACGGDALVTSGFLGVVSTGQGALILIDVLASPPVVLQSVPIGNSGTDIALLGNQRFVVSVDESQGHLSVVDLQLGLEVDTLATEGRETLSVEAVGSNSILVGFDFEVVRYVVGATGQLSSTGDGRFGLFVAQNISGPYPGANRALVLSGQSVLPMTFPGLTSGFGARTALNTCTTSAAFAPDSPQFYMLSQDCSPTAPLQGEVVERRSYSLTNGNISSSADWVLSIGTPLTACLGRDEIRVHPRGDRLYVPRPGGVAVYATEDGALLGTMTATGLLNPRSIALSASTVGDRRQALVPSGPVPGD